MFDVFLTKIIKCAVVFALFDSFNCMAMRNKYIWADWHTDLHSFSDGPRRKCEVGINVDFKKCEQIQTSNDKCQEYNKQNLESDNSVHTQVSAYLFSVFLLYCVVILYLLSLCSFFSESAHAFLPLFFLFCLRFSSI